MFYPDSGDEFYYIDPSERNRYISLDEYFSYLKVARINELQKIAQDLGAKHFKVTYKEEQTSFSEKKMQAKADVKSIAAANAEHNSTKKNIQLLKLQLKCHSLDMLLLNLLSNICSVILVFKHLLQ